ncbi:MAG: biopolymer transporter ExbD [Gammaproteobacteria bacterium]|nr:biopolymer transporter ExbD [Gammaproteobacteria bacterium]
MSFKNQKQHHDLNNEGVDVTPLLDIIFIVLIFFVVSASLAQQHGLKIDKAQSSSERSTESIVVVELLEQGDVEIDGRRIAIDVVKSMVQAKLSASQQRQVLVKVHMRAKTDSLVSVLDEIANIKNIRSSVSLLRS